MRGVRQSFLVILVICVVGIGGCTGTFANFGRMFGMGLYSGRPVPAFVFDEQALKRFLETAPDIAPATQVTVLPNGDVVPGGELAVEDYLPEAYGKELRDRLNLRSFSSLIVLPTGNRPVIHSTAWNATILDAEGCALNSVYATVTYKVVASFDYRGKGTRDWLVVSTQQVYRDPGLVLVLWLLVKDPRSEGLLEAELLGLEERRGVSQVATIMQSTAARERILELRKKFGFERAAESE